MPPYLLVCAGACGFALEELLATFRRTADHCSNVVVEMLQVAAGKLEACEYLSDQKSGELSESTAYNQRFLKYKAC